MHRSTLREAAQVIKKGGIVAYPTEAVYGLGCDPLNGSAVHRLLWLKQRPVAKGLILIASSFTQLRPYVTDIGEEYLQRAFATWPGPMTWLMPATEFTPSWIKGEHTSIAVRVTAHPLAAALCNAVNGPIVSTSANRSGAAMARTAGEVRQVFGDSIDYVLEGETGGSDQPTEIRNVMTNEVIRSG